MAWALEWVATMRRGAHLCDVPEAALGDVRAIHHDAHGDYMHQCNTFRRQAPLPWSRGRKAEGHADAKGIGPRPHRPDGAQAARVVILQVGKVGLDRLRPFDVGDEGERPRRHGRAHLRHRGAANDSALAPRENRIAQCRASPWPSGRRRAATGHRHRAGSGPRRHQAPSRASPERKSRRSHRPCRQHGCAAGPSAPAHRHP